MGNWDFFHLFTYLETESSCIAQAELELVILISQPHKYLGSQASANGTFF